MTRELGPLVALGNTSNVFGWGDDAVVKVLLPGIPDNWAVREAESTDLVHSAGLPAPTVLDLVTVDGRPGIVFERIEGASIWEEMVADPNQIPSLSLVLAEVQAEVNEARAPKGLPALEDRLCENIQQAVGLTSSQRSDALEELDGLPDGDSICHFDVHPNNVLLGSDKPVIIDWFDSAIGDPNADIARSLILMRPNAVKTHLRCTDQSIIARVHDEYIDCVGRTRGVDWDHVAMWGSTVLASRLAEPMPDSVLAGTLQKWRDLRSGGRPSTVIDSEVGPNPPPGLGGDEFPQGSE